MAEQPSQPEAAGDSPQANPTDGAPAESPEAMAEQAIDTAHKAAEQIKNETLPRGSQPQSEEPQPLQLDDLVPKQTIEELAAGLNLLDDIDLNVRVELGRTLMYVEDVLRLNENSVVELDKAAGDPVDIFVNDRHVARGEVLVLNESFCVRISEIIKHQVDEDEPIVERRGNVQSAEAASEAA